MRGGRNVRGRPRARGGRAGRDERRRPPAADADARPAGAAVTHIARPKRPAPKPPVEAAPVTVTSQRKGVATWDAAGVSQDLAASGASWYYDWGATPSGITAPASTSFVPMIWGAADVTAATLDQVKSEGNVLLGFNEPDLGGQANMTVAQALDLWPQLEATGMTLGSPAVSSGAATPGGWLDQFMTGAKARGYRVNFITVHWYGGDFSTGPAVQQLESYLQAIYDRYHLPIWLTEFALTSYAGPTPTFPTEAQQAAFLTAATTDARRPALRAALRLVRAAGLVRQRHHRPVQPRTGRDRGRPRLRGGPLTGRPQPAGAPRATVARRLLCGHARIGSGRRRRA